MAEPQESKFDPAALRKAKLVTRLVRALNKDCDIRVSTMGLYTRDDLMAIGAEKPGADPEASYLVIKNAGSVETEFKVHDWFKKNVLPFQKEKQPKVADYALECHMTKVEPTQKELMMLPAKSELSVTAYDADRTGIKMALKGKAVLNIGPLLRNPDTFEHVVESLEKLQGRRKAMRRGAYAVAALASTGLVVDGEMRRQKQPADDMAPLLEEGAGVALGAGTVVKALSGAQHSQMSEEDIRAMGFNLLDQFAGKEPSHTAGDKRHTR